MYNVLKWREKIAMNYVQAIDYLYSIPKFTHEPSLEPAKALLLELGSLEKGKKIIHVAGTNGKGSVCAYTASSLLESGKKVGLFTSPHLIDMEERIRINDVNVSKELFLEAFLKVISCEERLQEKYGRFSFFEYLFGMAMYCFWKSDVEYIVLETGLGGRLDATNAIEKPVMTIITPISLDHTAVLGDTLEAVAYEKAGIIKEGVPVVYWAGEGAVIRVIEETANAKHARTSGINAENYEILEITFKSVDFFAQNMYHKNDRYKVPFPAIYQVENALLAIDALWQLAEADSEITYDTVFKGIINTRWSGRFEEAEPGVIVDGAHNEAGILSFVEAVSTRDINSADGKKYLLFAVMKDKDYHKMIKIICDNIEFDKIIVTRSGGERGLEALETGCEFEKYTSTPVVAIEDWKEAFSYGKKLLCDNDTLFCVGSLYLVGAILEKCRR